jgi:hypothetical protein
MAKARAHVATNLPSMDLRCSLKRAQAPVSVFAGMVWMDWEGRHAWSSVRG